MSTDITNTQGNQFETETDILNSQINIEIDFP